MDLLTSGLLSRWWIPKCKWMSSKDSFDCNQKIFIDKQIAHQTNNFNHDQEMHATNESKKIKPLATNSQSKRAINWENQHTMSTEFLEKSPANYDLLMYQPSAGYNFSNFNPWYMQMNYNFEQEFPEQCSSQFDPMTQWNLQQRDVPMGEIDIGSEPKVEMLSLNVMPPEGMPQSWFRQFPLYQESMVINPRGHKVNNIIDAVIFLLILGNGRRCAEWWWSHRVSKAKYFQLG